MVVLVEEVVVGWRRRRRGVETKGVNCSLRAMCRAVGWAATVYHPMNSSDGKTCLSRGYTNEHRINDCWKACTLVSTRDEERVVDTVSVGRGLCGELERIDYLYFSTVLSSQQSTENFLPVNAGYHGRED